MNSLGLSLPITVTIVLQLAVFFAVSFRRHGMGYVTLHSRVETGVADRSAEVSASPEPQAAWHGMRPFRVVRKPVEGFAQPTCSIYLCKAVP